MIAVLVGLIDSLLFAALVGWMISITVACLFCVVCIVQWRSERRR